MLYNGNRRQSHNSCVLGKFKTLGGWKSQSCKNLTICSQHLKCTHYPSSHRHHWQCVKKDVLNILKIPHWFSDAVSHLMNSYLCGRERNRDKGKALGRAMENVGFKSSTWNWHHGIQTPKHFANWLAKIYLCIVSFQIKSLVWSLEIITTLQCHSALCSDLAQKLWL